MSAATVPVGTRHFCPSSWGYGCDRGDGKAPRKRCRRCGGQLVSVPVTYGVYVPMDRAALSRVRAHGRRNRRPLGMDSATRTV